MSGTTDVASSFN